jgi:hypothetical protein
MVDLTATWQAFANMVQDWPSGEAGMDMRMQVFTWDTRPAVCVLDPRAATSDDLDDLLDAFGA